MPPGSTADQAAAYFRGLQDRVVAGLEGLDGGRFREDAWQREGGGGGRLKRWCDEYFYLPHRGEARGVGGIFFDYLEGDFGQTFAFVRAAGDAFLESYLPIARRRKDEPYTPEQRAFQEYRRGRYVEFNLLHDRGTVFGLKTGGRVESILVSLPPRVRWPCDYRPAPGPRGAELPGYYLRPRGRA